MTLHVVPPLPPKPEPKHPDPLVRGLLRQVEVLEEDLAAARGRERKQAESANYWRESTEALIAQVGALFHRARAKPKGKRWVTVMELGNLLGNLLK